jgi:hypothetical protein
MRAQHKESVCDFLSFSPCCVPLFFLMHQHLSLAILHFKTKQFKPAAFGFNEDVVLNIL